MITIYELLEVNEDASKEEIEKAFLKLIDEYKFDENLSIEENNENRIILEKLKIAHDILINDEKRKKYDANLANIRAEELIKNVQVQSASDVIDSSNTEIEESDMPQNNIQEKTSEKLISQNKNDEKVQKEKIKYKKVQKEIVTKEKNLENDKNNKDNSETELTKKEKNKIKKTAKKEVKKNLKIEQKAEEEYIKIYNEEYNKAYNNYLRKMGFSVKEPWTLSRVKNMIIKLLIVICICIVIWLLPPTRTLLIQLYEKNFIIKAFVDIIIEFINIIISIFK